jgi:hypothetical protein
VEAYEAISGDMTDSPDAEELPPQLQKKAQELAERERALTERERGGKVQSRDQFDAGIVKEARNRLDTMITGAIAHAKKGGATIHPFVEDNLPGNIRARVMAKLNSIEGIEREMRALQALPANDQTKLRRLAAVDRHYQDHAPDVIRAVFEEAGIQTVQTAKERAQQKEKQADAITRTEVKGSTGAPSRGAQRMGSAAAFDAAQAEWTRANPGKPFDKIAREMILPRVLQLMTS